jgi:AcrR family transcriptional regulator
MSGSTIVWRTLAYQKYGSCSRIAPGSPSPRSDNQADPAQRPAGAANAHPHPANRARERRCTPCLRSAQSGAVRCSKDMPGGWLRRRFGLFRRDAANSAERLSPAGWVRLPAVEAESTSRASLRSSAQKQPTTLLSDRETGSGTRQRLLSATVTVVARRGYQESTVKDVIVQAGASRSTFYAHFANMEDCFGALLSVLIDELFEAVQSAVQRASPADAAKAAARALLDFANEQEAPARVLFCESLAGGARAIDCRDALIDEIAGVVEGRLQRTATLDLPASAAIGTVFRLLAHRMRRGASGLHELNDGVQVWLDAYATSGPRRYSRGFQTLGEQGGLPPVGLTRATPPPPVRLGSDGVSESDRSRNQRERILFACAQCCYEHGYSQMGIADIVSSASLSRTAFYEHFHDKQSAALAVLDQTFELTMTTSVRAYFAQESWPDRLWAGARALCEAYATHPAQLHGPFVEYASMGAEAVRLVHDRLMTFTLLLEDGYRQRAEGEHLPRLVSELIVSLLHEFGYREIRRRKPPERFYDVLPILSYMALAPFMGTHDASRFVQAKVKELKREGRRLATV